MERRAASSGHLDLRRDVWRGRILAATFKEGLQHRAQLAALVSQHVFRAGQVLLIKSALDNPGILEPLQPRREGNWG